MCDAEVCICMKLPVEAMVEVGVIEGRGARRECTCTDGAGE